ncbi:MAG: hypothetical protein WA783_18430 [Phormidesmis sp.]
MESFTLAAIALALVSKATEKVGETLGEGAIASTKRLLTLLRRRPDMRKRLEAASSSAAEPNIIDVEILKEAAADPEIKAAVEETAAAVKADQESFQNVTKLAEKIGVANFGTVNNPTYNISI